MCNMDVLYMIKFKKIAFGNIYLKCYFSLLAQYGDSADLKDGLLHNRVCTVKFPVVDSHFLCNTTHTEMHFTVLS